MSSHVLPRPLCQLCTLRFLQVAPMPQSSATADLVDSVQLQITFLEKKGGKVFQKILEAV